MHLTPAEPHSEMPRCGGRDKDKDRNETDSIAEGEASKHHRPEMPPRKSESTTANIPPVEETFWEGTDDELWQGEELAAFEEAQLAHDIVTAEISIMEEVDNAMISEEFGNHHTWRGLKMCCNCESEFGRNDDGEIRHFHDIRRANNVGEDDTFLSELALAESSEVDY